MRLHLPLICVFLSFGVSSYGQELYSEKDRKSLYDGAFTGCLEKQGTEGLNSYLKPSVISEFCDCAATEVVGDFLGDMDFQIALSRKNVARVKLLTEKFSAPNYTMPRFQLCFGRIETKYGGLMKMIKDTIVNSPSGKIGLEGESRRSFLMSGVYNCITQFTAVKPDRRTMPQKKVEAYCQCALNVVADNISHATLLDMIQNSDIGKAKIAQAYAVAERRCVAKLGPQ